MLVLGVDPGSRACGYALVKPRGNGFDKVAGGVIRPEGGTLAGKLAHLYSVLTEVVKEYGPDEAAVEKIYFGRNVKSALVLGEARGVVLAALAGNGVDVFEYTAPEIKRAVTGRGSATKEQVRKMVGLMFSETDFASDDESDAMAVAVCHLHRRNLRDAGIT